MATQQNEPGLPLRIVHDLHQFRLLELPPEILELIDSPTPPEFCIKSQPPSIASKPSHAVLCTPSKTFQLRQVQTSNSVFLAQPEFSAEDGEVPRPGICAIASCTATLELHPVSESPIPLLKNVLPIYDLIDGAADAAGNGKGRTRVFSDIPASNRQCQVGWNELVAFEFAGSSFRPSANTLSQVWRAINSASVSEGIKLDRCFRLRDVQDAVTDEGYPADLVAGVFRHIGAGEHEMDQNDIRLDRNKTLCFVGVNLLEVKSRETYLTAQFIDEWRDLVPEAWRRHVNLELIQGQYHLPSSTGIAFGGAGSSSDASATASTRKWHERFGRARQKK